MADPDQAVHFLLDGRPSEGRAGEVIISAAERAGVYIPRFCYHPRMKPVGMCRMCLVEVSGPRGATLQPSCFVHVAEGMEVTTTSEKVKKAQEGVLEFLLVNHPLDCPVCDKGGECPLQDQALSHGPGESRFIEEKRHFEKPVAISDLVLLDRERCIQCARCTRFAEEIAGEAQIDFAGRGERVEVATFPGRPFTSYFSGNTVQICPVGALTATPYRFSARPWDLDQVESTCTACAFGCRVAVQSSTNRVTRLLGLDSDPVNQTWLCDKGRFVFEAVNGTGETVPQRAVRVSIGRAVDLHAARTEHLAVVEEEETRASRGRLTQPLVRKDGELVTASWGEALAAAAQGLSAALDAGGPDAVALLGGARCTNEGAYAWTKFMKGVLRSDSVDAQLSDGLPGELVLSLPPATIDDACSARVVVLLTGDVREELPVLFLRLRGAALGGKTSILEISQTETSLTPYVALSLRARPGDAIAICESLAAPEDPEARRRLGATTVSEDELARARELLGDGAPGDGVVFVVGRPSLAEHAGVTAAAVRQLAAGLPGARFLPALRRGNVRGALSLGMAPGLMPGGVSLEAARAWFEDAWGAVPEHTGLSAEGVLRSLAGEVGDDADRAAGGAPVRALVLLGADPLVDTPDHDLARRALGAAPFVVAVAGHRGPSVERADVVLPVAVEHERPGTTMNIEGRVTRLGQKIVPPGEVWPDWAIATELAAELGKDIGFGSLGEVAAEMERLAPLFAGLTDAVLSAPSARDGLVVPLDPDAAGGGDVLPVDPMVTPGVSSADLQGSPFTVGLTHPEGAGPDGHELALAAATGEGTAVRPHPRAGLDAAVGALPVPHVPAVDHYSLRLVAPRRLYDSGTAVTWSPSLGRLVAEARLRANPGDLVRLGVSGGETVHVTSARGALDLPCDEDRALPPGSVAIDFGAPLAADGLLNAASVLIDAGATVTEVRLETVS